MKRTARPPAQPAKPKPQLREKLIAHGPEALSLPELLAIIFNTGTKGDSVEDMTRRVLKEYGSHALRDARDVQRLKRETGLQTHKACMLVACFELGRRLFVTQARGTASFIIRSPLDVCEYVRDMRELRKEQLRGLYLNARNTVIHDEVISIGTVTANLVCPRDVLLPAIAHSAVSVVVVHNHPSGESAESPEDVNLTRAVIEAGRLLDMRVHDHIVIGRDDYCSIKKNHPALWV